MNEVKIQERDLINVELLNCYNYYEVSHSLSIKKENLVNEYHQCKTDIENINKRITKEHILNVPEFRTNIFAEREQARESALLEADSYYKESCNDIDAEFELEKELAIDDFISEKVNKIHSKVKKIMLLSFGGLFGVLIICAMVDACIENFILDSLICALLLMLSIFGFIFTLIFSRAIKNIVDHFCESHYIKLYKNNVEFLPQSILNELDEKNASYQKKFMTKDEKFDKLMREFETEISKKYFSDNFISNNLEEIIKYNPDLNEYLNIKEERKSELSNQISELDIKILKLNTEEKNQLLNSLETLPVYYFNEDAVNKMLFLMANKRADTIKELVNLYEEIQWQNKLINGLADISLNIKGLVRDLNENFQTLGRQLKCINDNVLDAKVVISDSVNEMRNAILINAASNILNTKVLSQIKDDNAKHYLEMSNNINRLSCYLSFPTKDKTETHDHLY